MIRVRWTDARGRFRSSTVPRPEHVRAHVPGCGALGGQACDCDPGVR